MSLRRQSSTFDEQFFMGMGGKQPSQRNGEAELGERFIGTGTRKKEQQSEKVCLNLSSDRRQKPGVHPPLGVKEIAVAACFALQT